jgi:hypothetical protein
MGAVHDAEPAGPHPLDQVVAPDGSPAQIIHSVASLATPRPAQPYPVEVRPMCRDYR